MKPKNKQRNTTFWLPVGAAITAAAVAAAIWKAQPANAEANAKAGADQEQKREPSAAPPPPPPPLFIALSDLKTIEDLGIGLKNTNAECGRYDNIVLDMKHFIGKGTFGRTYQACLAGQPDICPYVAKFVPLDTDQKRRNFLLESYIAVIAGQQKIGPETHGRFICRGRLVAEPDEKGSLPAVAELEYGVIISDALSEKYGDDRMLSMDSFNKLFEKVEKMHALGIVHGDLYTRNVLFGGGRQKNEAFIIDFGEAWLVDISNPRNLQLARPLFFAEWCGLFFGDSRDGRAYTERLEFEEGKQRLSENSIQQMAWDKLLATSQLPPEMQKVALGYLTRGVTKTETNVPQDTNIDNVKKLLVLLLKNLLPNPKTSKAKNNAGDFFAGLLGIMLPVMKEVGDLKHRSTHLFVGKRYTWNKSYERLRAALPRF